MVCTCGFGFNVNTGSWPIRRRRITRFFTCLPNIPLGTGRVWRRLSRATALAGGDRFLERPTARGESQDPDRTPRHRMADGGVVFAFRQTLACRFELRALVRLALSLAFRHRSVVRIWGRQGSRPSCRAPWRAARNACSTLAIVIIEVVLIGAVALGGSPLDTRARYDVRGSNDCLERRRRPMSSLRWAAPS